MKYVLLLTILILTASCEQSVELRRYTELAQMPEAPTQPMANPHGNMLPQVDSSMQTDDPVMQKMLEASVAEVDLSWRTPKVWDEQRGSGMRLATFISRDADPIQCTIVSLSGNSGGLQANVTRWIRQIGVTLESKDALSEFLKKQQTLQSDGDLQVQLIDLTEFKTDQQSMLAAIVETPDKTIFVKMTGSLKAVEANRTPFKELCASLKIKTE